MLETIIDIYLLGVLVAAILNIIYCPLRLLIFNENAANLRTEIFKGNGNTLVFNFMIPLFVSLIILSILSWLGVILLLFGFTTVSTKNN